MSFHNLFQEMTIQLVTVFVILIVAVNVATTSDSEMKLYQGHKG